MLCNILLMYCSNLSVRYCDLVAQIPGALVKEPKVGRRPSDDTGLSSDIIYFRFESPHIVQHDQIPVQ